MPQRVLMGTVPIVKAETPWESVPTQLIEFSAGETELIDQPRNYPLSPAGELARHTRTPACHTPRRL